MSDPQQSDTSNSQSTAQQQDQPKPKKKLVLKKKDRAEEDIAKIATQQQELSFPVQQVPQQDQQYQQQFYQPQQLPQQQIQQPPIQQYQQDFYSQQTQFGYNQQYPQQAYDQSYQYMQQPGFYPNQPQYGGGFYPDQQQFYDPYQQYNMYGYQQMGYPDMGYYNYFGYPAHQTNDYGGFDNYQSVENWDEEYDDSNYTGDNKYKRPDQSKKASKKAPKVQEPPKPRAPKVKPPVDPNKIVVSVKKEPHYTLEELLALQNKEPLDSTKYIMMNNDTEPVNIVFIGHVDAGKSTLSGRILLNTNEVDEQEMKKFEQEAKEKKMESWVLAYIMDINEEERAKGKTVECGRAMFNTKSKRFTLFDAPGHKNYVPNMIMGACQADAAVLVISAKPGEFESGFEKGGQTQEHAQLARALGVSRLIVVITKMGPAGWKKERFEHIKNQLSPFLQVYYSLQDIIFIPIDGLDDTNITTNNLPAGVDWYSGKCLLDIFDEIPTIKRQQDPIRIPILDRMKDQGQQYLFGKVESGCIREDMWVMMMPYKVPFQIKEIQDGKDRNIFYAGPGENVKLKVKGLNDEDIDRGYVICNTDNFCQVSNEFQAEIQVLELPEHKPLLSQGYKCVLHMHTSVCEIEIGAIDALYHTETKKNIKASYLKTGQKGIGKLQVPDGYLCLEKASEIGQLGKFTLRDEGKTIAYGEVLKIKPVKTTQPVA